MSKSQIHIDNIALSDSVSEHYKKFFLKFKEIDELPISSWQVAHLLGYLCKRYEDYYGLKYSFKFNATAPSKCYEVYSIKKLANMLSSDPQILKDYLDWVFDKKVIERKKRITSLGYFTNLEIISEFKFKFLFNKGGSTISRTDKLPDNILLICAKYGMGDIKTYAELAFVKKMPGYEQLFQELLVNNFQIDILDKIA